MLSTLPGTKYKQQLLTAVSDLAGNLCATCTHMCTHMQLDIQQAMCLLGTAMGAKNGGTMEERWRQPFPAHWCYLRWLPLEKKREGSEKGVF